jgi:aspartyl-tRNA(Asn)/glutamyl-tRNA(Gln) amidotransferase subunit C
VSVSEDEVRRIANLARLRLTEGEVPLYRDQLTKILDAMAELGGLEISKTPPTASVLGTVNVLREDEPRVFPGRERILANAPERDGPYFKVRKVIE